MIKSAKDQLEQFTLEKTLKGEAICQDWLEPERATSASLLALAGSFPAIRLDMEARRAAP